MQEFKIILETLKKQQQQQQQQQQPDDKMNLCDIRNLEELPKQPLQLDDISLHVSATPTPPTTPNKTCSIWTTPISYLLNIPFHKSNNKSNNNSNNKSDTKYSVTNKPDHD